MRKIIYLSLGAMLLSATGVEGMKKNLLEQQSHSRPTNVVSVSVIPATKQLNADEYKLIKQNSCKFKSLGKNILSKIKGNETLSPEECRKVRQFLFWMDDSDLDVEALGSLRTPKAESATFIAEKRETKPKSILKTPGRQHTTKHVHFNLDEDDTTESLSHQIEDMHLSDEKSAASEAEQSKALERAARIERAKGFLLTNAENVNGFLEYFLREKSGKMLDSVWGPVFIQSVQCRLRAGDIYTWNNGLEKLDQLLCEHWEEYIAYVESTVNGILERRNDEINELLTHVVRLHGIVSEQQDLNDRTDALLLKYQLGVGHFPQEGKLRLYRLLVKYGAGFLDEQNALEANSYVADESSVLAAQEATQPKQTNRFWRMLGY